MNALRLKIVLLAGLALFLAGRCGYRLRGTGGFLPTHIKTVSVPMFKNLTTRFELDLKLTQSVINELVARGGVELAADEERADAVLSGEILTFNVQPMAFSGQGTADRYNIVIVARIVLRDRVLKRVLFSNPSYQYIEEYEVPQGRDFESMETEALNKVAEKFARSLVITILEGF
jgi:outer membrane lipopolysaccharide assembly protein LptE/RlpB